MNKKVYVANLPSQASEAELKALFPNAGDVNTMGSPESCLHAEPDGFHGEKLAGKRRNGNGGLPRKIVIRTQLPGWKGVIMNKERLEWIMSGLNQYQLTKTEGQFVKSALGDFDQNHTLTEDREERLESLYKEKSRFKPNKNSSNYFSFKESSPKEVKPRRPRTRVF